MPIVRKKKTAEPVSYPDPWHPRPLVPRADDEREARRSDRPRADVTVKALREYRSAWKNLRRLKGRAA